MKEILKETGIVESIKEKNIEIALQSSSNCEECTAKIFCNPTTDNTNILSVNSDEKFVIGDSVEILVEGSTVFQFTFFLYGLPLIILIASILLGLYISGDTSNSELYSFTLGVVVLTIYYFIFNYIIKQNHKLFNQPTIFKTDNLN